MAGDTVLSVGLDDLELGLEGGDAAEVLGDLGLEEKRTDVSTFE